MAQVNITIKIKKIKTVSSGTILLGCPHAYMRMGLVSGFIVRIVSDVN